MGEQPILECPVCHQPIELFFEVRVAGGSTNQVYKCQKCLITRLVRSMVNPASHGTEAESHAKPLGQ